MFRDEGVVVEVPVGAVHAVDLGGLPGAEAFVLVQEPEPFASTGMEGFGFFQDPDFQKRLQEMAEQMQASQSLAWADNAIKLAVDMTVAAVNRVNVQGTTEQQAQQIRTVIATIFPEAVTLVREARQGLS